MSTRLIAIDAATDTVHLALVLDDTVLTRAIGAGAQASAALLPALQQLLAEAGCAWSTLDAIAFGRGPGAFTGLRTAAAAAQGLALGLDRPVLALDTLAAVAEAAWRSDAAATSLTTNLWAAIDARMGEIYAAPWQRSADGRWQALAEVALYRPEALLERLDDPAGPSRTIAGNALRVHAALQDGRLAWPQAEPDGLALAALARRAWQAGEQIDAALALPLYVRDKVAQTTAERAAARAATEAAR